MNTMLILFVILTILNVIIQTVKSIATIKCGKSAAALVNAVAYGLYTYVVFFTACDGIDLHAKALITAGANLVGVWLVKYFEEKSRKDKMWLVQATVKSCAKEEFYKKLNGIPRSYQDLGEYTVFNIYCATQNDSLKAKAVIQDYGAKYVALESQTL